MIASAHFHATCSQHFATCCANEIGGWCAAVYYELREFFPGYTVQNQRCCHEYRAIVRYEFAVFAPKESSKGRPMNSYENRKQCRLMWSYSTRIVQFSRISRINLVWGPYGSRTILTRARILERLCYHTLVAISDIVLVITVLRWSVKIW